MATSKKVSTFWCGKVMIGNAISCTCSEDTAISGSSSVVVGSLPECADAAAGSFFIAPVSHNPTNACLSLDVFNKSAIASTFLLPFIGFISPIDPIPRNIPPDARKVRGWWYMHSYWVNRDNGVNHSLPPSLSSRPRKYRLSTSSQ